MINTNEIIQLVREAGSIAHQFSHETIVEEKGDFDYVTQIDIEVQEFLRNKLLPLYPEIPFLAEESQFFDFRKESYAWILDPIDGTTNLMHNYNASAVSLALYHEGEIVFGVIYNPFTDELFHAQTGKGAFLNNRKISCSKIGSLNKSLVTIGTSPYKKELADKSFKVFKDIYLQCQDIRRSGCASLDIAYVASGRVEAFFENDLKPWDYAAGIIILKEAGGQMSTWSGDPVSLVSNSSVLATNGLLHEEYIKQFSENE